MHCKYAEDNIAVPALHKKFLNVVNKSETGFPCSVGKTLCLAALCLFHWKEGHTTSHQKPFHQSVCR